MKENSIYSWSPTGAGNPPQPHSRHDDIWFVNSNLGWAVNLGGEILKTSDGGSTWERQLQNPDIYLRCIGFASENIGWAGGFKVKNANNDKAAILYKTINGGQKWTAIRNFSENEVEAICGLTVVNESIVYASGTNFPESPTRVLRTRNGGQDWSILDMSKYANMLVDIFFISPEIGWVIGGKSNNKSKNLERIDMKPVVLSTNNGGEYWINQLDNISNSLIRNEWGWKIHFLDKDNGFVSLENGSGFPGSILKTNNGGKTWNKLDINLDIDFETRDQKPPEGIEGIGFISNEIGWVGGKNFSLKTTDGGKSWISMTDQLGVYVNRFRFLDYPISNGYACGENVYRYAENADKNKLISHRENHEFKTHLGIVNSETNFEINFTLEKEINNVRLDVWDCYGAHVITLVNNSLSGSGDRKFIWHGTDVNGKYCHKGLYFIRLTIDSNVECKIFEINT